MALRLASQSPRRADLLRQLGVRFTAHPAIIDETPRAAEAPRDYVQRMALEKARAIDAPAGHWVLGADTTVVCRGKILGKPADRRAAYTMLQSLSGRRHQVCTAVCLREDGRELRCDVSTTVEFCELDSTLIESYLASGEPWDKAGAYGIQGLGGALVRRIEGSYSNVVGLPLVETRELLQVAGVPTALCSGGAV